MPGLSETRRVGVLVVENPSHSINSKLYLLSYFRRFIILLGLERGEIRPLRHLAVHTVNNDSAISKGSEGWYVLDCLGAIEKSQEVQGCAKPRCFKQQRDTSERLGNVFEELQERTEHFKALGKKKGCDVPWLQICTVGVRFACL